MGRRIAGAFEHDRQALFYKYRWVRISDKPGPIQGDMPLPNVLGYTEDNTSVMLYTKLYPGNLWLHRYCS